MSRIYNDNSQANGHTPLVTTNTVTQNDETTLQARIEESNPAYNSTGRLRAHLS